MSFLALVAYAPTLGHGFVWDDRSFIAENPAARNLGRLDEALLHGYGWVPQGDRPDASLYFRPVVTALNGITWSLFPESPTLFHAENILAHAAAAGLVAVVGLELGLAPAAVLVTASLFAVHPAPSEAVAWISGRTDLFATLFALAALALWLSALRVRPSGTSVRRLVWGAVCLFLALGSKESAAAVLPALALTIAAGRTSSTVRRSAVLLPIVLLGATLLLYLLWRSAVLGAGLGADGPDLTGRGGLLDRMMLSGGLVLAYLRLIAIPWPLAGEPPAWLENGVGIPAGLLGLSVLVGVMVTGILLAIRWLRSGRTGTAGATPSESAREPGGRAEAAVVGLALFVFGLIPVLQWVPTGEIFGERFLYLPLAGLAITGAAAVEPWLRGRARRALWAAPLIGAAFLLLQLRLPDWRDETSLFAAAVDARPGSVRALTNLGAALLQDGDTAGAERAFSEAVRVAPDDPRANAEYGTALLNRGAVEEGAERLETAWRGGNRSKPLLKNLGIAWTRLGQADEAAEVLREALARDPGDASVVDALALAERKRGAVEEAIELFQRSISLDPARRGAWLNLISTLYNEAGRPQEALVWGERFVDRFPAAPETPSVRALIAALADSARASEDGP